ncbi:hypothetical protein [Nocardiopsis sp. NRRL B-16309]|uniref:DUF7620 family protein n=1 Tax=Nocardiopsis sp. NRRL B-16309 TaxID=1519494 RepID=UPI0006ADC930|nr:hypothetical protein [Nocardiopsis sp. NRRL B-16309]KOX10152.1 hypothetical protein ADL05_26110 [Nocardiopsis sp. NRRL B-16309]
MKSWLIRVALRFGPPPVTEEEVAQIRELTERATAQTQERQAEVSDVVRRLTGLRDRNNFGPMVWAALRGESDV